MSKKQKMKKANMLNKLYSCAVQLGLTNSSMVQFGYDNDLGLYYAETMDGASRIFVSDKRRLELYKDGLEARQQWILKDYRIPPDLVSSGDTVLDVGANIGELGIWARALGADYIAFEPDPTAFRALQNNVVSDQLYDKALSDTNDISEFHLSTAEADSSLFKPIRSDKSIMVRTTTLDTFCDKPGAAQSIRLLKVEAEGCEPEVLMGAHETLKIVEYIAVDAGPERGGENTVPDVFNLLAAAGFELVDCFLLRGTFLFRKKAALHSNIG